MMISYIPVPISSAKFSQYSMISTNRPKSARSLNTARSMFQLKFESPDGFKPIITRKNRKLDNFTFQEHTNNVRNLKMKIDSIRSGCNWTERKKNPYDTRVRPALFFRKPEGKQKPLDYFDIGLRPTLGNQRKLVSTSAVKPQFTSKLAKPTPRSSLYQSMRSTRSTDSRAFALDSMDAEMYLSENFKSPRQPLDLFEHLQKSTYQREWDY